MEWVAVAFVVGWLIFAFYGLDPRKPLDSPQPFLEWVSESGTRFLEWISQPASRWLREPGNHIRVSVWIGAIVVAAITLLNEANSFIGQFRTEAISVAVAVIVLDELNRYRAKLEDKQRIIRQLASRSNDFALDAARIIVDNNWHENGSLKFANLTGANLKGAILEKANLEGAILVGAKLEGAILNDVGLEGGILMFANLKGAILERAYLEDAWLMAAKLEDANLLGANLKGADWKGVSLKGAVYDKDTIWPDGLDPKKMGALDWDTMSKIEQIKLRLGWQASIDMANL